MLTIKTDLHIHTALSTFADPDMTPGNITDRAKELKLKLIGITDYNSTKQALAVKKVAAEAGIMVLTGAEIISAENVHLLVYFEQETGLAEFQRFIDLHLPDTENPGNSNGYQIIFDEYDDIISAEDRLLFTPLRCKMADIAAEVCRLNGIIVAAHADRNEASILSEFGCVPSGMNLNALESVRSSRDKFDVINPDLKYYPLVRGSNAKQLKNIGTGITVFKLPELSFQAIRQALSLDANHDILII